MRSEFRYRQVHLDFHTSEHIEGVGSCFDKAQFVQALKTGHVNSVTCFARCHHGWAYYPSRVAPPHPHLECNLLGQMVEACRENDINIPIYITVQWDERTAREHPEWRVVHAEQGAGSSLDQLVARWHPICLSNAPFVDYIREQAIEVLGMFHPDGLFFDILLPWQCVCRNCIERMRRDGRDPNRAADRLANHRDLILEFYRTISHAVRAADPEMRIFYNSGHIYKGERERWDAMTHLELESLPTGGWGYDHFPVSARYANTLGMEYLGMTGKFHTSWGEFGGYKRPVALEYEACLMAAMGARCSVGDQLHPLGEMDLATYREIGPAYARVEAIEDVLVGAVPVSEVAILSSESVHHRRGDCEHRDMGAARMLLEMQVMFDVVDPQADFGAYEVLVLPDDIVLQGELLAKVRAYLAGGGAVVASALSCLRPDASAFAVDFPATVAGESEFSPDYIVAREGLDADLVPSPFVVYDRARKVKGNGAEVLAEVRVPYFNRTWEHFCSHQHTPYRPEPHDGYDAVLQSGRVIYFSHPIFQSYYSTGQPLLKYLFRGALNRLLPERRLQVAMPSNGRVSLMAQPDRGRTILHLLYAQTQLRGAAGQGWRGGQKMEIIEDVVPIRDVACRLRLERAPRRVRLAASGRTLDWTYADGYLAFALEQLYIHEAVVIEA
ncbi:MAG: beta-galactosidase trimerization domain-containing protein [Lentisphaeria bacterium]|nr:beta-galactosidase trimerization domain-containing protein [Lentisphaeria bacterium]